MSKLSLSDKGTFDFLVITIVIFAVFFSSFTVSSSVISKNQKILGLSQNDISLKEYQRLIANLPDDVCDDCDDDNPEENKKPLAYIFDINPNPSQEYESISFIGFGEDDDGEVIAYRWESNIDGILNANESFTTSIISAGNHNISFTVQDNKGSWSDPANVLLTIIENEPPSIPTISGPETGKNGEEEDYSFSTIDANKDTIQYYIEWGDDTTSGWVGPYEYDEDIILSHIWGEQGSYTIRAKAKDEHNEESDWGTLQISMPRNSMQKVSLMEFIKSFSLYFPTFKLISS